MCSKDCARIILIIFNILFFIAGAVLLGFGLAGLINPSGLQKTLGEIPGIDDASKVVDIAGLVSNCAMFMTILGIILFIFGFLGCGGALWMNKCLLFVYWVMIIIIVIAEIALIIFAATSTTKTEMFIKDQTLKQLEKNFQPVGYYNTITLPKQPFAISWVTMQFKVGCCGVNNNTDFTRFIWNNTYYIPPNNNTFTAIYPPSCCKMDMKGIPTRSTNFTNLQECLSGNLKYVNTDGCYDVIAVVFRKYIYVPIVVCIIIIILQLIAVACAVYLWKYKEEKD